MPQGGRKASGSDTRRSASYSSRGNGLLSPSEVRNERQKLFPPCSVAVCHHCRAAIHPCRGWMACSGQRDDLSSSVGKLDLLAWLPLGLRGSVSTHHAGVDVPAITQTPATAPTNRECASGTSMAWQKHSFQPDSIACRRGQARDKCSTLPSSTSKITRIKRYLPAPQLIVNALKEKFPCK